MSVKIGYLDDGSDNNLATRLAAKASTDDATFSERINAAKFTTLQAAIAEAQDQNGTLILEDLHEITEPITLSDKPFRITGRGVKGSMVKAMAAMDAVFLFEDAAQNNRFDFRDLVIECNSLADHGIASDKIAHSTFFRVRVSSFLTSGFACGFGWDNDFISCEASFGAGDGFEVTVSDANAVNFIGCKAFTNDGLGIKVKSGHTVNVLGCTIETCKKGGIYLITGTTGATVNLDGTYFEANAEDGLTFTTPAKTVKADVIVNGSGTEGAISFANPWAAVNVRGCFTSASHADAMVWAGGADALTLVGNGGTAVPMVQIYGDTTKARAPIALFARANRGFSKLVTADSLVALKRVRASGWDSDTAPPRNYLTADPLRYSVQVSGGGGTLSRSDSDYNGSEAWEITGVGGSDIFGVSLNMDDYPELAGQLVSLSTWAKASSTSTNLALYISSLGSSTESGASDTDWQLVEFSAALPATGTVKFGLRKLGGETTDVVTFSRPVLTVAGAPRSAFYRDLEPPIRRASGAPTTGTYRRGDFIWNTAPSANGILGWLCVTAGTPGTWVAVATLSDTQVADLTDGGTTTLHGHTLAKVSGGTAVGNGYVFPDLTVGKAVSTMGGRVVLVDDVGTLRWQVGITGGAGARGWVVYDLAAATERITVDATTGRTTINGPFAHVGSAAGFFNVTPANRPAALTQTYNTADRTLSAYTADVENTAYTGATDGEAKLADLNALRVAYETLRAFVEDLAQHHNALVDDLQLIGLER